MNIDFTAEIKRHRERVKLLTEDHYFDHLTESERNHLLTTVPTPEEVMVAWAMPVLIATELDRRMMISAQIDVLNGLWDDPKGWCLTALRKARDEHAQ